MIKELKHGELEVKLQICNDAFLNAIPKFEADYEIDFAETKGIGFAQFLFHYAYFAYKTYCTENGQIKKYSCAQFLKLAKDGAVPQIESNLSEVLEALTASFIDKAKQGQQESEGVKKNSTEATGTESSSEG